MVETEFGTSSAFRGWVRVRVLGYGFGVRGRKVKSRDCALASDLVRARIEGNGRIYEPRTVEGRKCGSLMAWARVYVGSGSQAQSKTCDMVGVLVGKCINCNTAENL